MNDNIIYFAENIKGEIALPKFITDNSFEAYKRDCEFHIMRKSLEYLIFIRPSKLMLIELKKNILLDKIYFPINLDRCLYHETII